ncbi:MAG: dethiobiotin synthase [Myxococcales bacterium]
MRVVILGTGTDVGKTYATACIARGLSERASVLALKPIESGAPPGVVGDAGTIATAAGHAARLSPWRFPSPVSPHLAAREQGATLDVASVAAWVAAQEAVAQPSISLVELAGGVFSPLGLGVTNEDLALALEPAVWLLVAPDALGVLHDVTATLRAMRRAPDALLLSGARNTDQSTGSNAAELSRLGIAEVLEVLAAGATSCSAAVEWLLRNRDYKSGIQSQ